MRCLLLRQLFFFAPRFVSEKADADAGGVHEATGKKSEFVGIVVIIVVVIVFIVVIIVIVIVIVIIVVIITLLLSLLLLLLL